MNGHYTSHYLAELLRDLFFEELTGEMAVHDPAGSTVRLHFDRGMLYFADGSEDTEHLEAHMAAAGVLPAPVIAKLKSATTQPLEMAARLIATGTLTKAALAPAIRTLVEQGVVRAFSWPSGTYEFTSSDAAQDFFDPDILFTFECILKGIEAMAYFGPLKDVLLRLPGRVRLCEKVFLPVNRLALKPHHGYILSRIDGSLRLDEIAMLMPPGEDEESLHFLYGLAVLGIVEFVPPVNAGPFSLREIMQDYHQASAREEREAALIKETAARIVTQSSTEILGVPPNAAHPRAQAAFEQARATFRRDRFSDRVREKYKKELSLIESKHAEAFLTLQVERLEQTGRIAAGDVPLSEIDPNDLVVRREMVKTEAQAAKEQTEKLAGKYFQKAREYFLEKDFHNCIQFCRLAIKFDEAQAPVYALMAEALAKNPNTRWQKMAEEAYLRAHELDAWNADYCIALGMFYKNQGLDIRARRQFEKALEILPSHPVAKEALRGRGR